MLLNLPQLAERLGGQWTVRMLRRQLRTVAPNEGRIKLPGLTVPAYKAGKSWYVYEAHLTPPTPPEVTQGPQTVQKKKAPTTPKRSRGRVRYIDPNRSGTG